MAPRIDFWIEGRLSVLDLDPLRVSVEGVAGGLPPHPRKYEVAPPPPENVGQQKGYTDGLHREPKIRMLATTQERSVERGDRARPALPVFLRTSSC